MGMFKWLKREFGGEARERRRNSQNISSSSIASESNHDIQRDDEYLRKLSKFNEWRSSQLSIKRSPDEGNSPVGILSRRKSQADLVFPTSGRTVDTRLSLGNNFRSIENPFFDDKVQERSIDVAVQARNNLSLTEVNSSRNVSTPSKIRLRKTPSKLSSQEGSLHSPNLGNGHRSLTEIEQARNILSLTEVNSSRNVITPSKIRLRKTPSKLNSQEGSLNSPNLANGHRSLTENDWLPNQNLVGEYKDFGYLSPPDNFYHNNSMPFMDTSPKSDEGYQRVINKHGDIVEYALPFCENSGDALSNSKRLPDIEERSAENSDVVEQNSESDGSSANIGGRRNSMPVNSKIYQKNKTKSHRKISDVEVKFIKNNNVTKTPRPAANDRSCNGESGNHNREFLEAIEDLVSLGKWSRRQLESTDPVLSPRNKKTVLSDKEVLKQISTVTPTSYTARVIVPHNSLCQTGNSLRGYAHSPLEWTSATWQGQDVSVRSRRRLPIGDLPQARAGMKRDVQVLSYVCHPNIALLMAVAQIDDLEISSVVEPFPATLHQILHHKPQPYPLPLETSLQYLQQLCGALSFLHNRGYIHTNVSSHCILITHSLATAKLSGFELAVRVDKKYHEYRDSPRKRYGGDTVLHIEELFLLNQRRKSSGREHSSRCKDSVPASEEDCSKPRAKSVRRKKENKTEYFTSVGSDKSRNNLSANFSDVCVWGEPQPVSDRAILAHYNWQAPELFCEVDSKVRSCTASDVFSLCVVLWECCTGSIPWYYSSSTEISDKYRAFTSLPKPKLLLPCFVDILTKGLEISPTQRTISLVEMTKLLKDAEEQVINITTENDFIKIIKQSKTNKPAIPVSTNISIPKHYTNETRREETYQQKLVNVNKEPVDQIQEPVSHTKDVVHTDNGINCNDFTNDDIKRMTAVDLIADIEERNNINNMFKPGYDVSHTSKEVSSEKFCVLEISTGKDNLCLDLNTDAVTSDDFPDTPSTCFAQTPVATTGVKDFTNSTEYFSMSDNKIMNVTEVSRNDGDKPVASNTPNAAFVYNFTPKSYTSLSITTPMSLSIPLDVGSSNFGSSKTSKSYSFNIENYELPTTPIARNTKIRKNTWLSESKLNWNTDIGMNKKSFSLSSNGIDDKTTGNRGLQSRSMVENSKDRNFFYRLSKPEKRFESPRSVKGLNSDASNEGNKVQINKMFSRQLNSTISFVGNETSTKVNALSVSMPTQSCRYKHTNRSVSPAVKPASHNTSAGCVYSHPRNENTRQFVCSPSSPYRVDAIKPASHQDELNSSSSDVIRAENYTKVPIDVKKAVTKKKILNMDTASFFESSLWQIEKRKCINRMLPEDPFSSSTPNKSAVILKTAANVENEPRTVQAVAKTAHRHVQTDFVTKNIIQSEDAVLKDHDISKIDTVTTSFTDFENIPGVQMKKVRSYDCKTLPTPKCKTLRARRRTLRSLQLSSDNSTFDGICELNNNGSKCANERLLNVLNNSLIYNTALDQSEETYWKGPIATQCSYCGSHLINGSVYKSQTLQTITLSPEISGLCEADGGNLCTGSDSLLNVSDDTLSLPGSIELPVTLTLKRYQAIPALQKVRSTEDLYFDDDFSQEQLGSHMQLSGSRGDLYYQHTDISQEQLGSHMQLSGSRGDLYYQHTDMTDLGELGFESVVTEVDGYEVVFDIFKPVNGEVDNKVEALNNENEIDEEQNKQNENEIDREQMKQNMNKNRNGNPTNAESEDDGNVERNLNKERNMEPTDVDDLIYGEQLKQNMYLTGAENEIDEKQNMEKDRNGNTTNAENEIEEQMKHNMLIYGIYENVKQNIEEKPNDELATDL